MNDFIDSKVKDLLNLSLTSSRLNTCLCIRIADYASQILGYRSTRQVMGDDRDEVENIFMEIMSSLDDIVFQFIHMLDDPHRYKENILSLSDDDLEAVIEDLLYEALTESDLGIFKKILYI